MSASAAPAGPRLLPPPAPVRRPRTSDEPGVLDAVALSLRYVDEMVVQTARDTHSAVAGRAFGVVNKTTGGAARVPQTVHDTVAGGVYTLLGRAFRSAARGLSAAGARGLGPRLDASAPGRTIQSAVNGLVGGRLRDEQPHLALGMSVRTDAGDAVRLEPHELFAAFPGATGRVAVYLHGLGEHEGHWRTQEQRLGATYASVLAASGWTSVRLRYNTGLSVAENGVALTALMQGLVEAWPVPVHEVALVGHSMGGLVVRAGCAVATDRPEPWTRLLRHVVTLGTPHLGADLALTVHHGARLLARAPEAAGFGRILDHRSPGIRDLERGLPDLPGLPGVRYHLVSAALGAENSVRGRALGDLLVRRGSATGTRRALRLFPEADLLHVPYADHFALLNHPDVQRAIGEWLR